MEASALQAPVGLTRISISAPLLRLRSDEQLVNLFRAGSEDAFRVIHDRYRQRLFGYIRQMLGGARQDAEDVLQDVFVRAYGALRADQRHVNLRAWMYRVAHNRCIDHLRRPTPPAADIFQLSRTPLHDPIEEAQRREDLRRLVQDVSRLPAQQRSALLMREIDGLSYAELAGALDVSVAAVKSLLVRARIGLVEAIEARDTDCHLIRGDLCEAYERGVKASGRARRHMRECDGCREYRGALRGVKRSFAALSPGAAGPLALMANVLGIGGAGGGAAAGGSAVAGGGAAAVGTVSACKVAAVVCTAAITAGGAAVEVSHLTEKPERSRAAQTRQAAPAAPAAVPLRSAAPATDAAARTAPAAVPARPGAEARERGKDKPATSEAEPRPAATPEDGVLTAGGTFGPADSPATVTGGAEAPAEGELAGAGPGGLTVEDDRQAPAEPVAEAPVTGTTQPPAEAATPTGAAPAAGVPASPAPGLGTPSPTP